MIYIKGEQNMKKFIVIILVIINLGILIGCDFFNLKKEKSFKDRFPHEFYETDWIGCTDEMTQMTEKVIKVNTKQYNKNDDIYLMFSQNETNFISFYLRFTNILETIDGLETSGTIKVSWIMRPDFLILHPDINIGEAKLNEVYNFKAKFKKLAHGSYIVKFDIDEDLPYLKHYFKVVKYKTK